MTFLSELLLCFTAVCSACGDQFSVYSLKCATCDWSTHLVISQSDQDDVWCVNPNLKENNTQQRLARVTLHFLTCTHGQLSPNCHVHSGWVTPENTPTQLHIRGFPVCAGCGDKGVRGRSGPSYLFPEFSSDMAKPLGSIEAHGLQTSVPQHFNHLSIFWKTQESRACLHQWNKLNWMNLKSDWDISAICSIDHTGRKCDIM